MLAGASHAWYPGAGEGEAAFSGLPFSAAPDLVGIARRFPEAVDQRGSSKTSSFRTWRLIARRRSSISPSAMKGPAETRSRQLRR